MKNKFQKQTPVIISDCFPEGPRPEAPFGFTPADLAAATHLELDFILQLEASGVIRSYKLPNGQKFFSHGEVAWLLGEATR